MKDLFKSLLDYELDTGAFMSIEEIESVMAEGGDGGSTPSQYGIPEGATDLQDLIEYRDMNFALGNIFKACYRMGTKNNRLYEINKIIWFAERLKKEAENDNA